jgi:carbon starvation protein CstA
MVTSYFLYGGYVDRMFGADPKRKTPACVLGDGVDCVPLPTWKVFLIQFLNIAGLGPIFGAILGAMYGPVVFLWITFGTIFAGAVHDYLSGMISVRSQGRSLPELIGDQLGLTVKQVMRIFTVMLMVLVGAVFVSGPANLLVGLTGGAVDYPVWVAVIFLYYIVSTVFPIDKVIGRIYPFFGFALAFMAIGVGVMLMFRLGDIPELTPAGLRNMHPDAVNLPIFPMLFITVACGAISGFHATQSPLMARCIRTEADGKRVFFGAMVVEGIVALIWAAAGMTFMGGVRELQEFMSANGNNPAILVDRIARTWLGPVGGILALIGVIAAPITSADTGMRAARLIAAEFFKMPQVQFWKRLAISLPLFAVVFVLLQINFDVIWRYFAWFNQTLSVFTLWAVTVYLRKRDKNFRATLLPGLFMTFICSNYILISSEGLSLNPASSYVIAGAATVLCLVIFAIWSNKLKAGKSAR